MQLGFHPSVSFGSLDDEVVSTLFSPLIYYIVFL